MQTRRKTFRGVEWCDSQPFNLHPDKCFWGWHLRFFHAVTLKKIRNYRTWFFSRVWKKPWLLKSEIRLQVKRLGLATILHFAMLHRVYVFVLREKYTWQNMYILVCDSTPSLNHLHFTYVYLDIFEYVHVKTKIIWRCRSKLQEDNSW